MARFTLAGDLRLPLAAGFPGPQVLIWENGRLLTNDQELALAIEGLSWARVALELPIPMRASPPYLVGHGQALAWLREYVMAAGYRADGDLVDPEIEQPPDVRQGPPEQWGITVA